MDIFLNSDIHSISDNELVYKFKNPIQFKNSYIHLSKFIFNNWFENLTYDNYITVYFRENHDFGLFIKVQFPNHVAFEVLDFQQIVFNEMVKKDY